MSRIRKFIALAPADRHLLVESVFLMAAVKAALSLLSFRRVLRLASRLSRRPAGPGPGDGDVAGRVAWSTAVARAYVPGVATCLATSLTAMVLLARRGCPAELRIGVDRTGEGPFLAHAWVESRGEVVVEGEELHRYVPFPDLKWESS
jgi:hypothetical protein